MPPILIAKKAFLCAKKPKMWTISKAKLSYNLMCESESISHYANRKMPTSSWGKFNSRCAAKKIREDEGMKIRPIGQFGLELCTGRNREVNLPDFWSEWLILMSNRFTRSQMRFHALCNQCSGARLFLKTVRTCAIDTSAVQYVFQTFLTLHPHNQ